MYFNQAESNIYACENDSAVEYSLFEDPLSLAK